jgi:hypothetical protein
MQRYILCPINYDFMDNYAAECRPASTFPPFVHFLLRTPVHYGHTSIDWNTFLQILSGINSRLSSCAEDTVFKSDGATLHWPSEKKVFGRQIISLREKQLLHHRITQNVRNLWCSQRWYWRCRYPGRWHSVDWYTAALIHPESDETTILRNVGKTASLATAEPSVSLMSNQAPLRSRSVEQCYKHFILAAIKFDKKIWAWLHIKFLVKFKNIHT